jgi:hypothetical protein
LEEDDDENESAIARLSTPYIISQRGEAMKFTRIAVLLFVLISSLLAVPNADAELIPSQDGLTVYDTILHVNWLANANLAATPNLGFVPAFSGTIGPNGSMDYSTAVLWVKYLRDNNYLGHSDWTLPTTPHTDPNCSATGPLPHQNSFGYGCVMSEMGQLFYRSLGLHHPNTAVPILNNTVGPFSNFQPYLYWSDTAATPASAGYNTFSFNTGFRGANVDKHYMYALPMIPGRLPCTNNYCPTYHATGINTLEVSDDGKIVYDPDAVYDPATGAKGVTWLANADLAKTRKFGAQCVNADGTKCINRDGSMTRTTAAPVPSPVPSPNWIDGMNAYKGVGWLHQKNWTLPPIPNTPDDPNCSLGKPGNTFGFNCTGNPLGHLFYQLTLSQGTPVVPTPDINVGPFNNIQPYLYWSSCEPPDGPSPCQVLKNGVWVPAPDPAPGFEFSFSFGNGFQGTDVIGNDLYVMVYFPETPAQAADTTAPVTTADVFGPLGSNGWYVGPTVVNFTAADDLSGVFKTEFSLNNGQTWTTGTSVSLRASAIHNILYRSTDFVGNVETPKSIIVKLDSVPPGTYVTTRPHIILGVLISLEVDLNAFDNLSGVAATEYSFDHGATWTIGNRLFRCGGTSTFLFRSIDVAGNVEKRQSITVSTPLCGASGGP